MNEPARRQLGKLPTSIPGLDSILGGGIPELSVNLIIGTPGSGKTILAQQVLFANASPTKKALYFTTLAEPSIKMLHYLQEFTFFDPNKVNREIIYLDIGEVVRNQGLERINAVILNYLQQYEPAIVVVDSCKAIRDLANSSTEARKFYYDLAIRLTTWGVITLLVGEYTRQEMASEPVFAIVDGIIHLHYQAEGLRYTRYVDVLKLRGENYCTGRHPFTISNAGLTVYPRIRAPDVFLEYDAASERISTGVPELDSMLHGGLPKGTATLVAGGTGTGKTLLGLHFIMAGALQGEPGLIMSFQENPVQLREIARALSWDTKALEAQGSLSHLYQSPVEMQCDISVARIREAAEKLDARRVLIDSITDLEIALSDKVRYNDCISMLINMFKIKGITILLTFAMPELSGPVQLGGDGAFFSTDNLILLRYVEQAGRMGRSINVRKMRGSPHSQEIREFEITPAGIRIGDPLHVLTG